MMGAAMLKRHRFVRSVVVSSITFVRHLYVGGVRRSPCLIVLRF